jgi:hypothetical protein
MGDKSAGLDIAVVFGSSESDVGNIETSFVGLVNSLAIHRGVSSMPPLGRNNEIALVYPSGKLGELDIAVVFGSSESDVGNIETSFVGVVEHRSQSLAHQEYHRSRQQPRHPPRRQFHATPWPQQRDCPRVSIGDDTPASRSDEQAGGLFTADIPTLEIDLRAKTEPTVQLVPGSKVHQIKTLSEPIQVAEREQQQPMD